MQRLKSFVFLHLWSKNKLFFADGPATPVHFIDWMASM